jgi:hypothetical protein
MSILTTENAVREAVDRTTGLKYVVTLAGSNIFLDKIIETEDVAGASAELTAGLRPWLLAYLRSGPRDNGWYTGCLVATDEDGAYDTYLALAIEDVIWYWDEECAPVSQLPK